MFFFFYLYFGLIVKSAKLFLSFNTQPYIFRITLIKPQGNTRPTKSFLSSLKSDKIGTMTSYVLYEIGKGLT